MNTIEPLPRSNKEIILHGLIGYWETRDQPNDLGSGFKIIPSVLDVVTLVQINHIVPGKAQIHPLI